MKKVIGLLIVMSLVIVSSMSVLAQNSNNHDSKGAEQVMDNFILALFEREIQQAVIEYYKDKINNPDSIRVTYNWRDEKYDVVEVLQTEKGRVLENSYVIKFTVMPQKKQKLGTDTITFGVEPKDPQGNYKINVLKYEHKAP